MSEVLPEQQTEFSPIDMKIKMKFQIALMEAMKIKHGDKRVQNDWVTEYAKKAYELIEKDPEIRT
ncbi:hypothetical protein KKD19_01610 [Patescibacteria group bacterium]|nr:hypothetical protein [Patescibacteria group bacterium]MCG2692895.1 hypothetical protein [Candidatus Parcubacteria bacterium]